MKADATIERIDAERAEHCKHFTGTTWETHFARLVASSQVKRTPRDNRRAGAGSLPPLPLAEPEEAKKH